MRCILLRWCGRRVYNHLYGIMPHTVDGSLAAAAVQAALAEYQTEQAA